MYKIFTVFLLVVIPSFHINSQDVSLLFEHYTTSSFGGVSTPFKKYYSENNEMLYYLAYSEESYPRFDIYKTDGSTENTEIAYEASLFDGLLWGIIGVSDSLYVYDLNENVYSIINGEVKKISTSSSVGEIYTLREGVVFTRYNNDTGERKFTYINPNQNISNSTPWIDISDDVKISDLGDKVLFSSLSATNYDNPVVMTNADLSSVQSPESWFSENNYGDYHKIHYAYVSGDYIYLVAQLSSGGLHESYIIDIISKERKKVNMTPQPLDFIQVEDLLFVVSAYSLYSYNITTKSSRLISNYLVQGRYERLDNLIVYPVEDDDGSYFNIRVSDGMNDSYSLNGLVTKSRSEFRVLKLGKDILVKRQKIDGDYVIEILREDGSLDFISTFRPIELGGTDVIQVRDKIVFVNDFSNGYNDQLYRIESILDIDEDGYTSDVDCGDHDPNINPDAVEIGGNDIDEDCDGFIDPLSLDDQLVMMPVLYPNPSTNGIVKLDKLEEPIEKIVLYNSLGISVNCEYESGNLRFDSKGLHFLQITTKSGEFILSFIAQ